MSTRTITLPEPLDAFVEASVAEGRHDDASAAVTEAVRLLEERDRAEAAKLVRLRELVQAGFDDLEAGRYVEVQDDELEAFLAGLGPQDVR